MKIKFLEGPYKGNESEFTSSCITIGRDGGNQLILDTDGVSRCHAELKQNPDGSWIICDLNSTNGVKVNNNRIDGTLSVSDGMVLTIGENTLEISQLSKEPARVIFNPIISTPTPQEPALKTPAPAPVPAPAPAPIFQPAAPAPQAVTPPPAPQAVQPPPKPESASGKGDAAPAEKGASAAVGIDIKKLSGSLFGQKGAKRSAASPSAVSGGNESEPKKKRSNLIFYTVLACVVVMVLSAAFSIMNPSRPKRKRQGRELPLALRYEKEIIGKDNVFRFDFQIKNGYTRNKEGKRQLEYTVIFTVDDIASSRHFTREVPLSEKTVEELRQVVRGSGLYATTAEKNARGSSIKRRLTVVDGSKLFETSVAGEYASTEFNAVEEAVIAVTETFGLKTIAMTPKELIDMAEKAFLNAEDLYGNRRAAATNLREAIKNYTVTVESLEQFSPKPPRWNQARIKLAAAVKEREQTLDALETEYRQLAQQRNFEAMKNVFRQIMDLTDPESREHSSARRRLIYIEQALRKRK